MLRRVAEALGATIRVTIAPNDSQLAMAFAEPKGNYSTHVPPKKTHRSKR
jgi:hypothetical protein